MSTGTLYNLFGSREALIDAVMPDLAKDALDEVVERASACEDPWQGFVGYVEDASMLQRRSSAERRALPPIAAEQVAVMCQVTEDRERRPIEPGGRAGRRLHPRGHAPIHLLFDVHACLTHGRHSPGRLVVRRRSPLGRMRAEAACPLPVQLLTSGQVSEAMFQIGESGAI
ncbi:TetR/AcrR family transcriptional regulator [Streptomyces chartreusis]|uniref:TetR/AcrR family transcriptional regulator n=1 Tax=Streptomyces chartreusis TaxID=1969 RepID=UPI002100E43D|nr:TetR/AcrR family transcriptional regulator [Streptomyces chartreusis]